MNLLELFRSFCAKIKYVERKRIMQGKYDVRQVAHWFVSRNENSEIGITKLMKLCYYAQAWYVALQNESADSIDNVLEKTEYQAWVHGPVSPDLYNYFSNKNNEDKTIITLKHKAFDNIDVIEDENDLDFLESVWSTYGDQTGFELEVLTHSEMPWQKARAGLKYYEKCTKVIDLRDIFEYYTSIYGK